MLAVSLSIVVYCGVNGAPVSSRSSSVAGTVVVSASSVISVTVATMASMWSSSLVGPRSVISDGTAAVRL